MSDRELQQEAYAAQLRFLTAMHQIDLPVTSGAVQRMSHGGYRVHLGLIEAAALDRVSSLLEKAARSQRFVSSLGRVPESGCRE